MTTVRVGQGTRTTTVDRAPNELPTLGNDQRSPTSFSRCRTAAATRASDWSTAVLLDIILRTIAFNCLRVMPLAASNVVFKRAKTDRARIR